MDPAFSMNEADFILELSRMELDKIYFPVYLKNVEKLLSRNSNTNYSILHYSQIKWA
jgi:hypothetical protein